jgi:DtxR family Mn-dependent transcriptional regulator
LPVLFEDPGRYLPKVKKMPKKDVRGNLSHTIEDYLKIIYEITCQGQRASTNQIAEALGVTPASVTGMIKKLAATKPPLLEYKRHHGVILTPQGELVALEIVRHHRLLEMFLQQMLGYKWDEVHAEADRLEHVISEEFEERIAQALGNPAYDPHGDPIPSRDLVIPDSPSLRLAELHPGMDAIMRRVNDDDPELLRYLSKLGLIPGTHLVILGYSPIDHNLTLEIEGVNKPIVLGPRITNLISVELKEVTNLK